MTVTWERNVTQVTWESATTPGVTWSTIVNQGGGGGGGGGTDPDAVHEGDGAGGFLSGTYPNPGVNTEALQDAVGAMAGTHLTYDDAAGALNVTGVQASSEKGTAGGYAELDGSGKVPSAQLPGFVDDVVEYANLASFPGTGETGKLYIALDSNLAYHWSGSTYVVVAPSLALGETSGTAYRGDRGKIAYDHSQVTGNPHGVTKADVGLGSVTNDAQIPKTLVDAKGDLLIGTDADTPGRLAVGADGSYLMGDANSSTGLRWVGASKSRLASATQYHSPESVQTAASVGQAAAYAQFVGYWPCYTNRRIRIDGIATWVFTQETGSTLRVGVAQANADLTPGTLIADYGTLSGASTGKKEATGSSYIDAGWFFLAAWASNHSTVRWMRATSFREPPFGSQIALGRSYFAWVSSATQDYSSGLPTNPPALALADSTSNPNLPIAQYRFT